MQITPIHPVFVARCEGVDFRRPLSAAEVAGIDAAMNSATGKAVMAPDVKPLAVKPPKPQ